MNQRNTIQRSLVLDAVRALRCHATAEEIYHAITAQHPDISRATVYRNLNLLSDLGEIRRVELPGGAVRYDHLCHAHYHARCTACGRVFDVEMNVIADLEHSVQGNHGFVFTGHDIIFKGVCLECNS